MPDSPGNQAQLAFSPPYNNETQESSLPLGPSDIARAIVEPR